MTATVALPPAPPVLRLDDLAVAWAGRPVLQHVSGQLARGEFLAVVGPNGAGKSSLLRALAGELAPHAGHIGWQGVAPCELAWLAQDAGLDRQFPISVADWLSLGDWARSGSFGRAASPAQLADALDQVGLAGCERRTLAELSGGQFQRLRLARVALADAAVVLLDEPFNAVDAPTTHAMLAVLSRWCAQGRTVVLVSHDLALVRAHVPRTLLLAHEPIAWGPTLDALAPAHLARAWDWARTCHGEGPAWGHAVGFQALTPAVPVAGAAADHACGAAPDHGCAAAPAAGGAVAPAALAGGVQ